MMKGQTVIHKLTLQEMRIKNISKTIATCELIHEEMQWSMMQEKMVYPVIVCRIENLIPKDEQLEIFNTDKL